VSFEWDPEKARANLAKHAVDFADAAGVFEDEMALTMADTSGGENRYLTVGADPLGRVIVVAYTWRHDSIRIISARRAVRAERRRYESKR
jgi:uncharacterized DUF497 family protein